MRTISFNVGKIFGIPISIDTTWLLVIILDVWLASSIFKGQQFYAILMVVAMYASVIVHELSHIAVAKTKGIETQEIHLSVFGGKSIMKDIGKEVKDEWLIAIVGPLTSLGLALVFLLTAWGLLLDHPGLNIMTTYPILFIGVLFVWNLFFACVNSLPIYPLDGGRIIYSLIMRKTGSRFKAMQTCCALTLLLGGTIAGWSLWQIMETHKLLGLVRTGFALFLMTQALGAYNIEKKAESKRTKAGQGL